MIESIDVTDPTKTHIPWWDGVEALKKPRKFEFKPGLNVLWGKNGSGKSTLLRALARMFHCEQGTFPTITQHSIQELTDRWSFGRSRDENGFSELHENFVVRHDGQPVRFFDPSVKVGIIEGGGAFDYDFGHEGIVNTMFKGSAGQTTMFRLQKLMDQIMSNTVPAVEDKLGNRINDYYQKKVDIAKKLMMATVGVKKGPPTVLLDEPERSFDFPSQLIVWRILRSYAKHVQFIVASHSLFALGLSDAHYVEMDAGYLELSKRVHGVLLKFAEEPPLPTVAEQKKIQETPKSTNKACRPKKARAPRKHK